MNIGNNRISSHTLDLRSLSSTREVIAYRDGGLFPLLANARNGSMVACVRAAAGHVGITGRFDLIRSFDQGLTWSAPVLIDNSGKDPHNPAFGVTQSGALLLAYGYYEKFYDEHLMYVAPGNYYERIGEMKPQMRIARSDDNGFSWQTGILIENEQLQYGSNFGKIVQMPDGTLLLAVAYLAVPELVGDKMAEVNIYGSCAYLLRSTDDGRTWGNPSIVAVNRTEMGLLPLPDGSLLAVLRDEEGDKLWSTVSRDGGYNWSKAIQVTDTNQHPADLSLLQDGTVLLTYGNRQEKHFRIEGRISRDNGCSWEDLLLVFSSKLNGYAEGIYLAEMGYPSTAIQHSKACTMYYVHHSIKSGLDWLNPDISPIYHQKNYMAVALHWDETELLEAIASL